MFVNWKDNELIYDLYHLAQRTIILRIANADTPDWDKIEEYNNILRNHFKLALQTIPHCYEAKKRDLNFYLDTPINDFPHLNYLIKTIGVSEVIPGSTLSHYMEAIKAKKIPIRMIINQTNMPPLVDGTVGGWVRPEDLWNEYYKYVDYIEFDTPKEPTREDLMREQALFRIYAEQKTWSGEVDKIVENINHMAINRLLPKDFGEHRANCRQTCEIYSNCHYCYRALDLADSVKLKEI